MAKNVEFKYAPMFQVGEDKTAYRLLTKDGVTTAEFEGKEIVKVSKEALTLLASRPSTMWSSCCAESIMSRWLRS